MSIGRAFGVMAITSAADIRTLSQLYRLKELVPVRTDTPSQEPLPQPSKRLNESIGLIRGDITKLAVDAIVNAANESLMGGGGVDGAIHRAAGPQLLAECVTLGGCRTGFAKITSAYRLPCKKVIHAVGPIYSMASPEASAVNLASCYTRSLELAVANGCKTVAFSAISTGVYGYPSPRAALVAIKATKAFLEEHGGMLDKVVFVTFEKKDVDAYNHFLPRFFPPAPEESAQAVSGQNLAAGAQKSRAAALSQDVKLGAEPKSADADVRKLPIRGRETTENQEKE